MTKEALKKHERALKWEKAKVEKAVNQVILSKAEQIVEAMAEEALNGNFQHGSYLLDRAFGKAKQSMDIESGGQPIIFMPTALVAKFGLDKPIEAEKIEEPNVYDVPNNG